MCAALIIIDDFENRQRRLAITLCLKSNMFSDHSTLIRKLVIWFYSFSDGIPKIWRNVDLNINSMIVFLMHNMSFPNPIRFQNQWGLLVFFYIAKIIFSNRAISLITFEVAQLFFMNLISCMINTFNIITQWKWQQNLNASGTLFNT